MKYYNLTKEEYKKYKIDFNKCYIGKQLLLEVVVSYITGFIFCAVAGFDIGYRAIESFEINLFNIVLFIFAGFSITEAYLSQFEYRKELKQYIIEREK